MNGSNAAVAGKLRTPDLPATTVSGELVHIAERHYAEIKDTLKQLYEIRSHNNKIIKDHKNTLRNHTNKIIKDHENALRMLELILGNWRELGLVEQDLMDEPAHDNLSATKTVRSL